MHAILGLTICMTTIIISRGEICQAGHKVYTKVIGNEPVCEVCDVDTFMPENEHSYTECFNCTKQKPTERLAIPCNATHDAFFLCIHGYYRLNETCQNCSVCNTIIECQDQSDTVCCPNTTDYIYDLSNGTPMCLYGSHPCGPGKYFIPSYGTCLKCPSDTECFKSEIPNGTASSKPSTDNKPTSSISEHASSERPTENSKTINNYFPISIVLTFARMYSFCTKIMLNGFHKCKDGVRFGICCSIRKCLILFVTVGLIISFIVLVICIENKVCFIIYCCLISVSWACEVVYDVYIYCSRGTNLSGINALSNLYKKQCTEENIINQRHILDKVDPDLDEQKSNECEMLDLV